MSTIDVMPSSTSISRSAVRVADGLDLLRACTRRRRPRAGEGASARRALEQVVAPVDGSAQRLLARRQVPGAARQEREALLEARAHGDRRQQLDARRREFDRQWQAVETAADLGDRRRVLGGHLEVRLDGGGALEKQRDRFGLRGQVGKRRPGSIRQVERGHGVLVLAVDVQRRAARHEHLQLRRGRDEARDEGGARDQVLEAVEHQEHGHARQAVQVFRRALRGRAGSSSRGALSVWEITAAIESGSDTRRQRHEVHAARESRSARSSATCSPSRVFPMPPGPVSVTTRTSGRSSISRTALRCRPRPTNPVRCTGRFVVACREARDGASRMRSRTASRSRARSSVDA